LCLIFLSAELNRATSLYYTQMVLDYMVYVTENDISKTKHEKEAIEDE